MGHGRGQVQTVEIGGSRDGDVEAYRLTVLQDGGAYGSIGRSCPSSRARWLPRVRDPQCRVQHQLGRHQHDTARCVSRGRRPKPRQRSSGPWTCSPRDRHRRRRRATAQPRAEVRRAVRHDGGNVVRQRRLRDRARSRARFRSTTTRCAPSRCAVVMPAIRSRWHRRVDLRRGHGRPDRPAASTRRSRCIPTAVRRSSLARRPHGQGHETAFAMIVQDKTGIPMERVKLVWGDTDLVAKAKARWLALVAVGWVRGVPRCGAGRRRSAQPRRRVARGKRRRRRARRGDGSVPCHGHARGRTIVAEVATAAAERATAPASAAWSTSPPTPPRSRSGATSPCRRRHRDRQRRVVAHAHRRRRRPHREPVARRGAAARRHRPGRGAGPARRDAYDARRQPDHRQLRRLQHHLRHGTPELRARHHGDADAR